VLGGRVELVGVEASLGVDGHVVQSTLGLNHHVVSGGRALSEEVLFV